MIMPATLAQVQEFKDKEAVLHLIQDDDTLKEVTGTIKVATEVGIGFKEKGKASSELLQLSQIEEIGAAPVKEKSITQKKLQPIEMGQGRQHLLDRHGVELAWAKSASEKDAFDWHEGLDHSNLGHKHVAKEASSEAETS
jgi:hypothetical protein